jgi:hypothetical protein
MIEPIMYVGIGFLVASLLAIMLLPLVHKRAVRLTARRIEAATPMSIAEIQAEKDHMRAENAMAMRRLELLVEETRAKAAAQLADVGKRAETIHRLNTEVAAKNLAISRLESSEKSLQEQLQQTQTELSAKIRLLQETQRILAEKESLLAHISPELDRQSGTADYQRIEIAALQTQIEDLKGHLAEFEKSIRHSEERLARERNHAVAAAAELADARAKAQDLAQKIGMLESQRPEGGATAVSQTIPPSGVEVDVSALQQELAALRAERDLLHRQVSVQQQQSDAGAAAERMENEMLRERINDVAAEVTRLTAMLEAESSPARGTLATELQPVRTAENGALTGLSAAPLVAPGSNGYGSLAERIRALQARAAAGPAASA